ncbi:MAG: hypothetical protein ACTTJW_07515 [Sphaerochaeta sp.]
MKLMSFMRLMKLMELLNLMNPVNLFLTITVRVVFSSGFFCYI